jgi:siroheme synthase-like protein
MSLYPVFLKLKDVPCLVIGGGAVAERKVKSLLEAEASITVISPSVTEELQKIIADGNAEHRQREYREGDLDGYPMVIASTNSREVNAQVFKEATERKVLINSVDDQEHSSFFMPSVIRRGDLQIAISTSGKVPYFAMKFREFLQKKIYTGIVNDLQELHQLRKDLLESKIENPEEKKRRISALLDPRITEIFEKIDAI